MAGAEVARGAGRMEAAATLSNAGAHARVCSERRGVQRGRGPPVFLTGLPGDRVADVCVRVEPDSSQGFDSSWIRVADWSRAIQVEIRLRDSSRAIRVKELSRAVKARIECK